MRLIDADAIRLKQGFFEEVDNVPKFYDWLDEQPTVDAVRVVRCKDCKWLGIGAEGDGTKLILCIKKHHDTTEEDYCSEGVNREDDPSD